MKKQKTRLKNRKYVKGTENKTEEQKTKWEKQKTKWRTSKQEG